NVSLGGVAPFAASGTKRAKQLQALARASVGRRTKPQLLSPFRASFSLPSLTRKIVTKKTIV
ncbi:hypothetical protein, partial [Flavobacterium sp.]|uniref:hypothetical protein n=1 Tax=Flavobacterium sp. TaxID=239 RepID=UPI003B9DB746